MYKVYMERRDGTKTQTERFEDYSEAINYLKNLIDELSELHIVTKFKLIMEEE